MTANFANQKVVSKVFRDDFTILMKQPERSPLKSLNYPMDKTPKVLLSQSVAPKMGAPSLSDRYEQVLIQLGGINPKKEDN
jgi:hypothetical protein